MLGLLELMGRRQFQMVDVMLYFFTLVSFIFLYSKFGFDISIFDFSVQILYQQILISILMQSASKIFPIII